MNSVVALKLGVGCVNLKSVPSKISARSYQPIYLICGFDFTQIEILYWPTVKFDIYL